MQKKKERAGQQSENVLPKIIADWVRNLGDGSRSDRYRERAKRFTDFAYLSFENHVDLGNYWKAIEKSAKSEDDLLNLFIQLPDEPLRQPYSGVFGKRAVDSDFEQGKYDDARKCIKGVKEALGAPSDSRSYLGLRQLMSDASVTPEGLDAASKFREVFGRFMGDLQLLDDLLSRANPYAKIPSHQARSLNVAEKNYAILVSNLNAYLANPKWTALAYLANVNCPSCNVSADQLRKLAENS